MKIGGLEVDDFLEAARDLRYLLGQEYPRLGALTFVGNRYQLAKDRREVLNRGVYPGAESLARRRRLRPSTALPGRAVALDGYNVLITLESALLGREIIECDDGPLRDTAQVSGSFRPSETTDQALKMILDFLTAHRVLSIIFFFTAAMPHSGTLVAQISAVLAELEILGRAMTCPAPKTDLADFVGLVATSDSVIIDRVADPIDLAGLIIKEHLPDLTLTRLGLPWTKPAWIPPRPTGSDEDNK